MSKYEELNKELYWKKYMLKVYKGKKDIISRIFVYSLEKDIRYLDKKLKRIDKALSNRYTGGNYKSALGL